MARTLSTVGLLLIGGLVTSDVLERFSLTFKWLLGLTAVVLIVGAILVWSDEDTPKEGE